MALAEELQDLLKFVEPADAETLTKLFEKSPKLAQEIKDGRLRQADYSRFMNENKAKLSSADQAIEDNARMKEWYDRNKPRVSQMQTAYEESEAAKKVLESELNDHREKLQKLQSGELNVDEATLDARVEKRVKELGYVPKTEMETIIRQEAKKLVDEFGGTAVKQEADKFLKETWPTAQAINHQTILVNFQHMQEFGKPLTGEEMKVIADRMTELNTMDPQKAYDDWVKPERDKREIEKQVTERVEAKLTEERSKMGFPGVSGVPVSELGPVQLSRAGKIPELPANSVLGDGSAALAAAAEMRAEAKG